MVPRRSSKCSFSGSEGRMRISWGILQRRVLRRSECDGSTEVPSGKEGERKASEKSNGEFRTDMPIPALDTGLGHSRKNGRRQRPDKPHPLRQILLCGEM